LDRNQKVGGRSGAVITEPDETTSYGYDAASRLISITEPYHPSGNGGKITYSYPDETHTTMTYPNGASEAMTYDISGRLLSIIGKDAAGTTQASYSYTYGYTDGGGGSQDGGLRGTMTWSLAGSTAETTTFSYDSLGRLTQANPLGGVNYQYCYDATGNLLAKAATCTTATYHYNAGNEQTDSGYSFDANGSATAIPADPTMAYNAKNQTSSITPTGGTAQAQSYAGTSKADRVAAGTVGFVNDQLGLARRYQGGADYYTRDASGRILGERTSGTASGNYYYLFDGLGSVVAMTNSAGAVVATYKYDPYGNITYETSGAQFNPIRYAGYYWSASYGTYKVGERFYDPAMGRWTQRDPINQPLDTHGWNPYTYAGDDPINLTDPSGLCSFVHCLRGAALQAVAAVGSYAYSIYYVSHNVNRYAWTPQGAGAAAGGLGGDIAADWLEHKLGDSRTACDEGRQRTGTIPVTHDGPQHIRLPGAVPTRGGGCRIELP
jgi:RHS repeat-associated protein